MCPFAMSEAVQAIVYPAVFVALNGLIGWLVVRQHGKNAVAIQDATAKAAAEAAARDKAAADMADRRERMRLRREKRAAAAAAEREKEKAARDKQIAAEVVAVKETLKVENAEVKKQLVETHDAVNSKMEKMMKLIEEEAFARGAKSVDHNARPPAAHSAAGVVEKITEVGAGIEAAVEKAADEIPKKTADLIAETKPTPRPE